MVVFFLIPDDLHEAKGTINEMNRRLHEFELELRRLENERDELTAAYKEAEAVSLDIFDNLWKNTSKVLIFN